MRELIETMKAGVVVEKASETRIDAVNLRKFTTDRPSKKLQAALNWFAAHPGNLDTPSREIANEIGVSHMTVHKAQQIMKEQS